MARAVQPRSSMMPRRLLGRSLALFVPLALAATVASACRAVAPARWRRPRNYGTAADPRYVYPAGGWNLVLYDCAGRTRELAAA